MNNRILLTLMGCGLFAVPALADTRDDVLAGMQRCQSIRDDRTWLDCTYGAQQPMRAKLGLPPAPDFQQRLVPSVQLVPSVPLAPSAAPSSVRTTPAPPPRRNPSFFQILTGSAAPVAVSTLTGVRYDREGAFVITLENGQVWHQVNADFGVKAKLTLGAKVTITPGALGSYNMKSVGDPHGYKVEQDSKR
ncbi:MAG TPA: hypothetical protein VH189_04830 [Rhizomicrobium sp.]|nr:hypothetical protein [Rhizomicrobium sp.]